MSETLKFESREEFLAIAEARLRACWEGQPEDRLNNLMTDALRQMTAQYDRIASAAKTPTPLDIDAASDDQLVDWGLWSIYGRGPLVSAVAIDALNILSTLQSVVAWARNAERSRIAQSLHADMRRHYGDAAAELIQDAVIDNYNKTSD